jgi:hypothetical protein
MANYGNTVGQTPGEFNQNYQNIEGNSSPPLSWIRYLISVGLTIAVAVWWIVMLLRRPWYEYCYFKVGPLYADTVFNHWDDDETVHDLKSDICSTVDFDHQNPSKTEVIATLVDAFFCPKSCHYFKTDILEAADTTLALGIIAFALAILAAGLLTLTQLFSCC